MRNFVLALALLAASPAQAADGDAKGTLVVAGKSSPIAHAYVIPDRDGDVTLLLTDIPLSDKALQDVFERIGLADDGKLHAVEATIGSDRKLTSVSMRHNAFRLKGGGFSSDDVLEITAWDATRVAGRLYRKKPGDFFGTSYTFEATFTAARRK
jgi:hypothetical protein